MFEDVDWTYRADYMRTRHGISTVMANEALRDPNRLVIDPDPASRSGKGTRVIGWSQKAGHVVTVIVVIEDGVEYGANGWRTDDRDLSAVRRTGAIMTKGKQSVDQLLAEESDAIEADRDAPIRPDTRVTRGHSRTRTLQVRLNDEEYELLSREAENRHLPESTLARSLLLDALAGRAQVGPGEPPPGEIDLVHARALVTELGSLLHVELRAG